MKQRTYIAIDLKSFYASVECRERGLDPMTTNLVVADESRTAKTICLAVSPSLKSYGIPGRARLFEVIQKVREINASKSPGEEPLEFITAVPRLSLYMDYSKKIFETYLKYIAPEDIHVYSIDEVFMDVTDYLRTYDMTAEELAAAMMKDVLYQYGITATAGIGPNMFLCKVAMDIWAKHIPADENGARIAVLDEMTYRRELWTHTPITDFWRVGRGYARKLAAHGMFTMGDIARCSLGGPGDLMNEDLLYKLFGVGAELLIDHAWGWEPCTIAEVKAYRPQNNSLGSGQVLQRPYDFEKGRLITWEMTDLLSLDLVRKGLVTNQLVLTISYDVCNLTDPEIAGKYRGEITTDYYGRKVPRHAHGTFNLDSYTSSGKKILDGMMQLFDRIVNPDLLIRRVNVVANHVIPEAEAVRPEEPEQLSFFVDYEAREKEKKAEEEDLAKEHELQKTLLNIKEKFGKNAILKGANLEEGAMTISRNQQIGGHKA